jgi:uncharacterized protein (DUF2147 family)
MRLNFNTLFPFQRTTLAAFVVLALMLLLRGAHAGALDGIWTVEDGSARVRIAPCGDAFCGNVISIGVPNDPATGAPWRDKNNVNPARRDRPLLGLNVATGMKPDGTSTRWIGRVYSIDYGREYAGSITLLSPTRLKIEGCQMLICQSEIWTKAD